MSGIMKHCGREAFEGLAILLSTLTAAYLLHFPASWIIVLYKGASGQPGSDFYHTLTGFLAVPTAISMIAIFPVACLLVLAITTDFAELVERNVRAFRAGLSERSLEDWLYASDSQEAEPIRRLELTALCSLHALSGIGLGTLLLAGVGRPDIHPGGLMYGIASIGLILSVFLFASSGVAWLYGRALRDPLYLVVGAVVLIGTQLCRLLTGIRRLLPE